VYFLETIHAIGLAVILVFVLLGDRRVFDDQYFGIGFVHFYGTPALFAHSILVDIFGAIGGLFIYLLCSSPASIFLIPFAVPLVAQCIYAHRIRLLTCKKVIPWLIIAVRPSSSILNHLIQRIDVACYFTSYYRHFGRHGGSDGGLCKADIFLNAGSCHYYSQAWTGLNAINDLIIAVVMVRTVSLITTFTIQCAKLTRSY